MAELSLNGGGEPPSDGDIPTGLNRIKTRRVPSSKDHHSSPKFVDSKYNNNNNNDNQLFDSPNSKKNQRPVGDGAVKLNGASPREGLNKGKKIAQWFTSYLFKSSDEAVSDIPPIIEAVRHATGKQNSLERTRSSQVPKGLKSFSHELGPRGGIRPVCTRAQSFNDLKELLGSLRSKFDTAKEVVNAELACFKREVMEVLQKNDILSLGGHKMAEDLLTLSQECIDMTTLEFRVKCETIVLNLTKKRQQCQAGLLKWLLTRLLFILTRCTRLLHFEKNSELVDEKSLQKFKKFLEQIPYCEASLLSPVIAEFDSVRAFNHKIDSKQELQGNNQAPNLPQATWCKPEVAINKSDLNLGKDFLVTENQSPSQNTETSVLSNTQQPPRDDNTILVSDIKRNCGSLNEQEQSADDSDLVICRICEEHVPTPHLESHSYICAYADKLDEKGLDVDERLLGLAEVLEQIIESRNLSAHTTHDSPETSRMQITSSAVTSEGCSPKIIEWRNKGVEGMFEDIHEMDTACIEDAQLTNFVNMRSHSALKLNHCGPPSSTGSMTSASSTNTPKAGNFDLFWLEQNHPSEMEDVQRMSDLVDIAHNAACTDLSKEGSHEYLLDCMQDLQEILQHSKLKALVIDTFGRRIEDILREKYMHACELVDTNSGQGDIRHSDDNTSQGSNVSTPLHKDRTSIDDFEIIKPISRGAYGKVFLSRKRTTGDLFAIKVLKKLDLLRKNDIERIVAERNILITVRNPFVVRFFYSFTSRDHLYLVMEYLNGGDLFSLLRNVGCLDEDVARIYVAELVLALEYLHSRGIVHRDLKPDNILIAHDGHIKLTDFGLSKIGLMNSTSDLSRPEANENAPSDTHDQINQHNLDRSHRSAVGTPDYLAPEILLGTEHGYAADWWSVGVILFEFITGLPPFTAEHPEIIFDNILNRKIPWPHVPNDMSNEAQDLIDRFLVHDPNQRLGAEGSSQVKAHPFFKGVSWDTLASQKAAFVPQPDSVEDTSYFISRYNHSSSGIQDDDQDCSDSASDTSDLPSSSGFEKMDQCGDLAEFESPPFDVSWMNFSFKNLSQLAAINHEVLLQSAKDSSKCLPPNKGSSSP